MAGAVRVATLESLFTADLTPYEKGARAFEARNKQLDGKVVTTKVDADTRAGTAKIDQLETRIRRADATVDVDADTAAAESAIEGLADTAEGAGSAGGDRGGKALVGGIVAALASIPIAGAVAGIAEAAGNAVVEGFQNGLAVEVRADRLAAATNLDPAAVARLGSAAGEAYADNFGESIDANMDTARRAVQSGLLDPKATQRDAQDVISSLSGVADVLEEDVSRVSRSTAQLLRTGLAKNAQEAFDIIVAGQQAGLNVSEDWLDTLDEYSTQWRKLGLEGGDVLGLLQQGVQAGARDTDIVADSLKELSIRAIDGSTTTVEGFRAIGLSAEDMGAKFAAGGTSAREALGETLDGLRSIEDPVARDAAAVALFGTQAEDLGKALYALDLDTAAQQFEDLEGRASRALATLGDNTAGDLETAKRNIEVGVTAIQGALAGAFADDIQSGAEFVAENREAVVQFLLDAANAALDFGRATVEGAASGTEALGDFGASLAPLIQAAAELATAIDAALPGDQESKALRDFAADAVDNLGKFDEGTEVAADNIRRNLIENGLDPAQRKLNEFGDSALSDARLSDATKRLSNDIADVGYAADGSKASLDDYDGSLDTTTRSGRLLDEQIRGVKSALEAQVGAAAAAGESQKELRGRVASARAAFIDQMTALGLTRGEARKLADAYGLVPKKVVTEVTDNGSAKRVKDDIDAIPSQKTVRITTIQEVLGNTPTGTGTVLRNAGGGAISGPGTGTSDSILSWLSNGEHVVPANEVQMAGGQGGMYRLRQAIRAGVARFAGGGAVESQRNRVNKARDRVADARDDVRRARTDAQERRAEKALSAAETALDREREKLARLQEQTTQATRSLRRGDYTADLGTIDELYAQSENTDLGPRTRRNLAKTAREAERELAKLEKRSETLAKHMQIAADRADDLRATSERTSGSLVGEFSLAGAAGGSTTNQFGETSTADPSARGIVASVKAAAARILGFGKKLKELAKAGLKGRSLDEIAQLGSEQGTLVADAFLADRSQIAALNAAYSSLDSAGAAAGQAVTEGFYKGGLSAAEALVYRREREQASLDRQYDRLGDRLGKAIARSLGIKARAGGGSASAGRPYLVNEDTPFSELFVPNQSGTILNRAQMGALGGGTATFSDAQVAVLAAAIRQGAQAGIAGYEDAQDRQAAYVGGL